MGIELKDTVYRSQLRLSKYLSQLGLINHVPASKGRIVRLFESHQILHGKAYDGSSGVLSADVVDISGLLWKDKIPDIYLEKSMKKKKKRAPKKRHAKIVTDKFLLSYEWRKLRYQALKKYGGKCQCCGRSPADGAVLNVDHIQPRKKRPDLALNIDNLQVLCGECNHGKGNWDETDWRG